MSKSRKFFVAMLLILALGCLSLFAFTACKSNKCELASISITKLPQKTAYTAGSQFNPEGMEVTAFYTDNTDKVLAATDYTYRAPSMTVASGRFEESKTVEVSYTEGDITQTASLKIKVTNKVIAVEVLNRPDKTVYINGEAFDPTGLKIRAEFENNSSSEVDITEDNASFSVKQITSGTEKVTVTYGGYSFDIQITVQNGIYIEAETGLLNGQNVGGANYRTVNTNELKEGVLSLYGAHLKVNYETALLEIKKAELIAASTPDIESELNAYRDSEEYKSLIDDYQYTSEYKSLIAAYENGTNNDIAEWNYKTDSARYQAHDGAYLGDLHKGDVISFVFEADKEGSGVIALRLSSTYLLEADDWTPIEIGSLKLNEICEVSVNGVKCNISNDAVLEGGKTEDGSPNSILWSRWTQVNCSNINFTAGRNVIHLKIRNHSIVSPAQSTYEIAPNIDSLIITPDSDEVQITAGNNSQNLTYKAESVSLDTENGATLIVQGDISVNQGYVDDIFNVKLGPVSASITIADNKFTALVDVSQFDKSEEGYAVTICGEVLTADGLEIDTDPVSSYRQYRLDTNNFVKLIIEDGNYSVQVTKAEFASPEVELKTIDGKPYIVIGGGSYEAKSQGFASSEADQAQLNLLLALEIKKLYFFEVENYPIGGLGGWGEKVINNGAQKVNILTDSTFEVVCDLSALQVGGKYGVHFAKATATDKDFNSANFPAFTKLELTSLTLGATKYEAFYKDGYTFEWNCLAIFLTDIKNYKNEEVSLEKSEDNKVFLVVNGSYECYTKTEMEGILAKLKGDYRYDKQLGNLIDKNVNFTSDKTLITVTETDGTNGGTYTIKLDITGAMAGTVFFHLDFSDGTTNFKCALSENGTKSVKLDNIRFNLYTTANTGTSGNWADGLVAVDITDLSIKTYGKAEPVNIETDSEKAYLVITGDCTGYTSEELKQLITLFDFENSTDKENKMQANTENIIVEVADERYT